MAVWAVPLPPRDKAALKQVRISPRSPQSALMLQLPEAELIAFLRHADHMHKRCDHRISRLEAERQAVERQLKHENDEKYYLGQNVDLAEKRLIELVGNDHAELGRIRQVYGVQLRAP